MSAPTIAIIGRPNVGKSTLFNRIIGRRQAIVDAQPGVTRDRHFAPAEWNGRRFWLVDTGGLVPGSTDPMNRAIRGQVEQAVAESDVLVFLVDVQAGVHPQDLEIAQYLRKVQRPILLVATQRTSRASENAQVCVLVVDASDGLHEQEMRIADDAWEKGVGVVIAVNKWDLIEEKETNTAVGGEKELKTRAPLLAFIPFYYV